MKLGALQLRLGALRLRLGVYIMSGGLRSLKYDCKPVGLNLRDPTSQDSVLGFPRYYFEIFVLS